MEQEKENMAEFFAYKFYDGFIFGAGSFNYPEHQRSEFVIFLPFIQFAWVKMMMNDEEAEKFLDDNSFKN